MLIYRNIATYLLSNLQRIELFKRSQKLPDSPRKCTILLFLNFLIVFFFHLFHINLKQVQIAMEVPNFRD